MAGIALRFHTLICEIDLSKTMDHENSRDGQWKYSCIVRGRGNRHAVKNGPRIAGIARKRGEIGVDRGSLREVVGREWCPERVLIIFSGEKVT